MTEQEIVNRALTILEQKLKKPECSFTSANDAKSYLKLKLADLEHEVFSVAFLNSQHGLIELKELFRGTVDASAVYPREVVKATLGFNAAAVIFAHNHPSGICQPSHADKCITERLTKALKLIDVKVLDHIVVDGVDTYSFAEHGLI